MDYPIRPPKQSVIDRKTARAIIDSESKNITQKQQNLKTSPRDIMMNIARNIQDKSKTVSDEIREFVQERKAQKNEMVIPKEQNKTQQIKTAIDNSAQPEIRDKETASLYNDMKRIQNTQLGVDMARSLEYLTNAFQAQNQPRTVGFRAPSFSYTPLPNTRDRDLAAMRGQISSEAARAQNLMEERGMVDFSPAVLASMYDAIQKGNMAIGDKELQKQAVEAERFDKFAAMQSGAEADIFNKNIEKTMNENAALGAEYTGNMENFFRTATDLNRQLSEKSIIKSLALSPTSSVEDLRDQILYGKNWLNYAKNQKNREYQSEQYSENEYMR